MTYARPHLLALGLLLIVTLLPASAVLMQDATAQEFTVPYTTDFLVLGLVVVALILAIWVARLVVRFRTLHKDADTLASLAGEGEALG